MNLNLGFSRTKLFISDSSLPFLDYRMHYDITEMGRREFLLPMKVPSGVGFVTALTHEFALS
jgi:hypothetical protein